MTDFFVIDRPTEFFSMGDQANQEASCLTTHATPVGVLPRRTETLTVTVNFSTRREISQGGQFLTGTPTVDVLLNGLTSTDLIASNAALDPTLTKVTFTLTNVAANPPSSYLLIITAQLTGGETLVEGLTVEVGLPPGGMLTEAN